MAGEFSTPCGPEEYPDRITRRSVGQRIAQQPPTTGNYPQQVPG